MHNGGPHDPKNHEEETYDTLHLVEGMRADERRTRYLVVGIVTTILIVLIAALVIAPRNVADDNNQVPTQEDTGDTDETP